jgi:hypothetical protein
MGAGGVSYAVFQPKLSTHHMHDPGSIVPHIRLFTDNQMSWIKYNYYVSNVSKYYDDSQWNITMEDSITPHEWQQGATRNLELLVKEFQSIFSFWVVGENSKVEYTYGWYSASAGIKW